MPDKTSGARVALVTGCGRKEGLGASVARALARRGLDVIVTDVVDAGVRSFPGLEDPAEQAWAGIPSLVEEIESLGVSALSVTGDVASEEDTRRIVATALERFGRIDVLVNNAGAPRARYLHEFEKIAADDWDAVMAVNVRGPFLLARAVISGMRSRGWGRIINISSVAAKTGGHNIAVYAASKAALMGLSRCLALEYAPYGVTINAICPGRILTSNAKEAVRALNANEADLELQARLADIPVGRMGQPTEVADLIAFLVTDQAAFITGQAINIDGGTLSY